MDLKDDPSLSVEKEKPSEDFFQWLISNQAKEGDAKSEQKPSPDKTDHVISSDKAKDAKTTIIPLTHEDKNMKNMSHKDRCIYERDIIRKEDITVCYMCKKKPFGPFYECDCCYHKFCVDCIEVFNIIKENLAKKKGQTLYGDKVGHHEEWINSVKVSSNYCLCNCSKNLRKPNNPAVLPYLHDEFGYEIHYTGDEQMIWYKLKRDLEPRKKEIEQNETE